MGLNEYFIRTTLWPSVMFTIALMIAGCLGNSLIVYVYRNHFYRSVPWLFIYVLSVLDLLACLISMPSELVILFAFSSFPSGALCKISRYLSFTFHGSSCVILMAIAFNRYEKVCRPNNQLLNLRKAKMFCAGTIIFACVGFLPCLVIYGGFEFPLIKIGDDVSILPYNFNMTLLSMINPNLTSHDVINGTFCTITKESPKGLVLGFYFFQFFLYVTLVVLIVFFYSKVICKMVHYGQKQRQMLFQMSCQASRTDYIRQLPNKRQIMSLPKDEPTADFSKDFSHDQNTDDFDNTGTREKSKEEVLCPKHISSTRSDKDNPSTTPKHHHHSDTPRVQISTPILEENGTAGNQLIKEARSENNIHLLSTSASSNNPLETNRLLMRRFKSSEDFKGNISHLQILPPVDLYEAMFEPLFLHAPKTHKKKEKGSVRKSKKKRSKSISRSKSNVDISLRTVKPAKRDQNARSLEGLATLHCGMNSANNAQDGTLTLTRLTTPKGTKNCIIPISTTLSMKSAVSYSTVSGRSQSLNHSENSVAKSHESADKGRAESKDSIDSKGNEKEGPNGVLTTSFDQQSENEEQGQPIRRDTVSFKPAVTIIEEKVSPIVGVHMRRRSDSTSGPPSASSENILTPSPKKASIDTKRRQSVRPIRTSRTSRILFWISLAFVLSFLPFWIIVIIRTLAGPNILAALSHIELGAVSLFIRFTLISNAINPLIYGLMNSQFRQRCSEIISRIKKGSTYKL